MTRTVYIETTIPSYYHETRRTVTARAWREATRRWWSMQRQQYRLVTSRFVLTELRRSPPAKSSRALALMAGVEVLPEPAELDAVTTYYIEQRAMPAEAGGDAYHLAMASLHNVDYLLTWNCRHLANMNKTTQLAVLNGRLGLHLPIITTPLTLMSEDEP
jgi:hypothetical protein